MLRLLGGFVLCSLRKSPYLVDWVQYCLEFLYILANKKRPPAAILGTARRGKKAPLVQLAFKCYTKVPPKPADSGRPKFLSYNAPSSRGTPGSGEPCSGYGTSSAAAPFRSFARIRSSASNSTLCGPPVLTLYVFLRFFGLCFRNLQTSRLPCFFGGSSRLAPLWVQPGLRRALLELQPTERIHVKLIKKEKSYSCTWRFNFVDIGAACGEEHCCCQ